MNMTSVFTFCTTIALALPLPALAEVPDAIAAPGETPVATINAQGAQIYQCMPNAEGKLVWKFREPIATLLVDDKTVGRHFAGPNWEMSDGSGIAGKVAGTAPGASAADIPLLRLQVVSQRGQGLLSNIVTVQRLNTKGGIASGDCPVAEAFLNVPYSADYIFYRKP